MIPKIDPEFSALIPPLQADELAQLEENILRDGCREPLTVWRGLLIDGHNRLAICQRHGLKFATVEVELASRDDALLWIIRNQFGRRNLPAIDRVNLAMQAEPIIARLAKSQQGKRTDLLPNLVKSNPVNTQFESAKQAGVSHGTYDAGKRVIEAVKSGALPADTIDKIRAGERSISGSRKELDRIDKRRDRIASTPIMPDGKYNVVYVDPPWQYEFGKDIHGAADRHYGTLSIDQLCALPIPDICDDNCVMFMWATSPKLFDAKQVIEAWGFDYKTSFVWDKVKHVMGHYNSVRHEFLLICVRGSFPKQSDTLHDSVITIERSDKHSEKPEYFRELIEQMYPISKRVELFARCAVDGWAAWGNEL